MDRKTTYSFILFIERLMGFGVRPEAMLDV